MASPDPNPSDPVPPYAPLGDALTRAVSTPPWWRRRTGAGLPVTGRRGAFPALAALGAVLVLSLLGIAAPWNTDPTPAQGGRALDPDGPVLLDPSPAPANPPGVTSRLDAGRTAPTPSPAPPPDRPCQRALSVVASADIAPLVRELAGSLAGGDCPQVTVRGQGSAGLAGPLAYPGDGGAPDADVWIPASSLSLRLASGGGDFPASGESIARTPVVIALPKPVADSLTGYPVWILIYNEVTGDGKIPRMSMPDHRTTVGALAQVTLQQALLNYVEGDEGRAFLSLINFRNHVAATDADVGALLDRMAGTAPDRAGTDVGAFPATEQQLIAYHRRGAGTPVVPMGTYDAHIEADYPLVVSSSLPGRLARIADELHAQLRSPAAVQRLLAAGFRAPDNPGASTGGLPAGYQNPFPSEPGYPDPVPVPDSGKWHSIVDGWTWQG
jgi:hypothetical protein